jgi:type I restriction enzyme, S subunit
MSSKKKTEAMKKDGKPALMPKLRFPGFQGAEEWKSIPLSRLAIRVKQKNRDGTIDRVLTNSAAFGVVDQRDFFDKDIATQGKLEGYFVVELGSYVYNPRISSTAPVGPISKNKVGLGVMSPLYTVFKFKDDRNDFYEQFFKTAGWHAYMRQASGTGARHDRMAISNEDFMAMALPVPTPAEQQKIAECLSSADEVIAAQARKLDALKTHKKGLMQQLFPAEGEAQPRLRFPEFQSAGKWEEKKLDQLVNFQSGGTPSKANAAFWSGSVPWVSAKDMKQLFLEDAEDHISTAAIDDGAKLVPPGTLLMLVRGMTLLKDVPICVVRRELSFNQDVKSLGPKNGVNGLFLALLLTSKKGRLREMVSIAGHGTGKLDTDELKAMVLLLPSPPEQQRIATCLSSLDALITAEIQKLEVLKLHKKGLMQQLFPYLEQAGA